MKQNDDDDNDNNNSNNFDDEMELACTSSFSKLYFCTCYCLAVVVVVGSFFFNIHFAVVNFETFMQMILFIICLSAVLFMIVFILLAYV